MSDTETTTGPTPNNMPGASTETTESTVVEETTTEQTESEHDTDDGALTSEERVELDRLRAVHADEKKWEKRSKENFEKAKKWDEHESSTRSKEENDEIEKQQMADRIKELETRDLRNTVAKDVGVEVDDVHGATEDEMRESAERFKAKVEAAVEQALKDKVRTPAAAPASTVTSSEKIAGPTQVKTRDELAKMNPRERMKAYREGRLKELTGA